MPDANDPVIEQAHQLRERAERAIDKAAKTLHVAQERLARWRLESDRVGAMRTELETLAARLHALEDAAESESLRRAALRIDLVRSAKTCRVSRRLTTASRERLARRAASVTRR